MTSTPDHRTGTVDLERLSNWGRWGSDDQRGCLNHITDAVRAAAVAEAHTGRTVTLARPVHPMPLAGGPFATGTAAVPAAVSQAMTFTGTPPRALTDLLVINTHHASLTHLDALGHIPSDGHVYPGRPVSEVAGSNGLAHASTTAFAAGILTRGVLADLAPGGALSPGTPVTGADLDAALARTGTEIEPGDALVVRGGWDLATDHGTRPLPGMTTDAVAWMHDHRISLYLGDIGDAFPALDQAVPLPLHQIGLARLGLPLVDVAAVEELASTCAALERHRFLLILAPMPLHGATGVPVTPLAIF